MSKLPVILIIGFLLLLTYGFYIDMQLKKEYMNEYKQLVKELSTAITNTEEHINDDNINKLLVNNKNIITDRINILFANNEYSYFIVQHNNLIAVSQQFLKINDLIILILNCSNIEIQVELLHQLKNEIQQFNKIPISNLKDFNPQQERLSFNLDNLYNLVLIKTLGER